MNQLASQTVGSDFACILVYDEIGGKYHINSCFRGKTEHLLESHDKERAECYMDGLVDGMERALIPIPSKILLDNGK
jgi:hypothetical protein